MHIPLEAQLTITDSYGRETQLLGGYGRWLMPGAAGELEFRTKSAPAAGDYRLKFWAASGIENEPIEMEGVVKIPTHSDSR